MSGRRLGLKHYIARGIDSMAFTEHLADWLRHGCNVSTTYPIVFARRSELWRHLPNLTSLFDMDLSLVPHSDRAPFVLDPQHIAEVSVIKRKKQPTNQP